MGLLFWQGLYISEVNLGAPSMEADGLLRATDRSMETSGPEELRDPFFFVLTENDLSPGWSDAASNV